MYRHINNFLLMVAVVLLAACGGSSPKLDAEGVWMFSDGTVYYTVKPGDTLWRISKEVGISVNTLQELNSSQLNEESIIYPGQTLTIGHVDEETVAAFTAIQRAGPVDEWSNADLDNYPGGEIHVVQKEDTLALIAEQFNISAEIIISINELDKNKAVYIGQELVIPMARIPNPAALHALKVNQILVEVSDGEKPPGIFVTIHGEFPDTCTRFWLQAETVYQFHQNDFFLIRLQPFNFYFENCEVVPQSFTYQVELHYDNLEPGEYKVNVNGVAEETFSITEEQAVNLTEKTETLRFEDVVIVNQNEGEINIRSGPGLDYPVVGTLQGGDRVQVFGKTKTETWLQTQYEGGVAWIYAPLTDFVRGTDFPVLTPPPTPIP